MTLPSLPDIPCQDSGIEGESVVIIYVCLFNKIKSLPFDSNYSAIVRSRYYFCKFEMSKIYFNFIL